LARAKPEDAGGIRPDGAIRVRPAQAEPILGTEFSGVITAIGASVTRFASGDEVFGFVGAAMGAHAEYLTFA
jgi:NADPH:quinone reductase-like Zn-dependent oxidoreductase